MGPFAEFRAKTHKTLLEYDNLCQTWTRSCKHQDICGQRWILKMNCVLSTPKFPVFVQYNPGWPNYDRSPTKSNILNCTTWAWEQRGLQVQALIFDSMVTQREPGGLRKVLLQESFSRLHDWRSIRSCSVHRSPVWPSYDALVPVSSKLEPRLQHCARKLEIYCLMRRICNYPELLGADQPHNQK